MSSIDTVWTARSPKRSAAKPVPPAVRIAQDFVESPLAVLGLGGHASLIISSWRSSRR
jgi:peptide/nickel transport system permease protein